MTTHGFPLWFPVTSALIAFCIFTGANGLAGEADILDVRPRLTSDGTWSFAVTVRHDDEGWDHYADRWEILTPDGKVIATRILAHPHETEQPFTRSLSGIEVPSNLFEVRVRAHDSVHGYGGAEVSVPLPLAGR